MLRPSSRTERRSPSAIANAAAILLRFTAAPSFAAMALLAGIAETGSSRMICSGAHGASPFTGMAAMYLLMSLFHAAPWLALGAGRPAAALTSHPTGE